MIRYRQLLLLSLLTSPLACGEDALTPEEALTETVDDLVVVLDDQAGILCNCWEERRHDSRGACEEVNGEAPPQAVLDCITEAYELDTEASQDRLDCLLPLERDYNTCASEKLECDNFIVTLGECAEEYGIASRSCVELPDPVVEALDDCFPEEEE